MKGIKRRIIILIFLVGAFFHSENNCLSNDDVLQRLTILNGRLSKSRQERVIKKEYRSNRKRDPFVSPIGISIWLKNMNKPTSEDKDALPDLSSLEEIKDIPSFILSGIVYSKKGDSLAIINNEIVRSGEEIDGAKVINIELTKVKLLWKNKEIYLSTEGSIQGGKK